MQLIHAIVALVAASQATAIASNANLTPRSSIAEASNMKYTREIEGSKAKRDGDDDEKEKEKEKEEEPKCFNQCSPHPGQNPCHESAPCTYVTSGSPKFYCGCPAGLKPENISPENAFRLPWFGQEGRVFVKPGVSCLKLCDDILTCGEVAVQPQCF